MILEYITSTIQTSKTDQNEKVFQRLKEKASYEAERWRFQDILDFFKEIVDPNLIGQVKQIYDYRNWIAHGKKKKKPTAIEPHQTHERLTQFLREARLEPEAPPELAFETTESEGRNKKDTEKIDV